MGRTIGIASDHGGRNLKQYIVEFLQSIPVDVKDFGVSPYDASSVDYPDYAQKLTDYLKSDDQTLGILICGTGIGMSIAANKVPGIRAAVVWDEFSAEMSKAHNNANVLCLGERTLEFEKAKKLIKIWLDTEYEGGRHQSRLDKISALETGSS